MADRSASEHLRAAVPVIDLAAAEPDAVRGIARACEDWGFFQVVGHGVDPALTRAAMAEARAFFARPGADKRGLSRTARNPWGYYDRELTKNLRDKKEIFDIGPEAASGGEDGLGAARIPWPADREAFRSTLLAYAGACEALSRRLLGLVCLGLRADRTELDAAFAPASTSFLRLNHYPVRDPLADVADAAAPGADLGIHHHTDAGALTVLLQDQVEGLQVWRDAAWRAVAPTPGAFVVNIGDMIQVWTNDLYAAPVHRVLAMDAVERLSLPLFFNPGYEAVVAPLARCTGPERPARYRPIRWGEFRQRRADGDFADYGAEVQISDYATPPA
jgi:isopenicillin N synthase-like dioxygenase